MQEGPYFTPEEWETAKIVIAVIAFVPALFLLRAAMFFILPRSVLKFFFMTGNKPTMSKKNLRRRHKIWEDD